MAKSEHAPAVSPAVVGDAVELSLEQIHRSCRAPILFSFVNAAIWLVVASLFALIAAIKLHKGSFLAECPWLTYGRMQPAQTHMFLYGFACQAAFGVILFLLCRLGRTLLIGERATLIGLKFWNLGVLIGTIGILTGDLSGYQWFDMPRYAAGVLFFAYLVIAASALFTFAARRHSELYISQWLVFAAVLIFAWLLSTAILMLHVFPARGMMQAVVNYWYANGLFQLFLAPVALAAIFYLVPKASGTSLYSRGLAVVSFWLLIILGGWSGIAPGARLPAWMPSISTVASVALIVPALSFAANWYLTLRAGTAKNRDLISKFATTAGGAYVVVILLGAIASLPQVAGQFEFTHLNSALAQLGLYGVVAMAIFGAAYFIVPQLLMGTWCGNRMKAHFILSKWGFLLVVAGLIVAGVRQGSSVPGSVQSVKASVPFIGIATLGVLMLLAGNCVFLSNLLSVFCKSCCKMREERRTR